MVLGHEGVGVVQEVGPDTKNLKPGDRVGWGYQANSCGRCDQCLNGDDEYCDERQIYGEANLDQGSLAEAIVWREAFLFRVPDNISDAEAAPLMCGGATVWTALHKYGLTSSSTVGVIGIGGLGHLAIQFASKMGMNVVALSTNDSKKEEALRLGATKYVVTSGAEKLDIGSSKLDALIVTSSVETQWDAYLPLLKPRAMIIPLTVHFGNLTIPQFPLIGYGFKVQGTVIASRWELGKMLDFAARNGVRPVTVKFPMTKDGIEESMKELSEGRMRYRGVLIPV
ncbi:nadp-dependent alcohol dehydrogenase protein [Pochonia chlamydosporia 170]|uniref:Nadp-dependent alcohol dehydrogenase protein n=1 Tax=Pochonia chlamydosporia 170 TaxID=1380566 RepID=A0A179G0B3_METCM|nr:nadp-dependent alcohol dehydrogenase protein [Pochonia chlamydosporia 170]OAQ71315.1 nadp-dependent alcohol dehydrogenase protein [Pochonia chlamydosporia 170]